MSETIVVHEREKPQPKPLLFLANGAPVIKPDVPFGFHPPATDEAKKAAK